MSLRPGDIPFVLLALAALALAGLHASAIAPSCASAGPSGRGSLAPDAAPAPRPSRPTAVPPRGPKLSQTRRERIAAVFVPPPRGRAKLGDAAPPAPPPEPVERADWLRLVGSFEDGAGRLWTLVKDGRSGRVLKLSSGGAPVQRDGGAEAEGRVIAAGADGVVVEIGSKRYAIKGR